MAFDFTVEKDVLRGRVLRIWHSIYGPTLRRTSVGQDIRNMHSIKADGRRHFPMAGSGNAKIVAFDLRLMEDVLPWPSNAHMEFRLTVDGRHVLPWLGNANMAFDLRPTKDVLPWPGNANMAFDLWQTEDVLSWPGNANMAFDLRPTEDVLSWPGNANMAFDLYRTCNGLLCTFLSGEILT
ncbi:hypothetical protein Tco_0448114 [Tanacetum coccineum]